MTGGWRKPRNEDLYDLYFSSSIVRIIKSRRISLAGQVARVGIKWNACRILVGNPEEKILLGRHTDVGGWIILKWF
jgi:hypothetical protein